jgi:hypothetical protein
MKLTLRVSAVGLRKWNRAVTPVTRNVEVFGSNHVKDPNIFYTYIHRLCGLVVRVPGYSREMYCVSCEVGTEFTYVM